MNLVIAAVAKHHLLLLQDARLPNAVTVVTGEHPRGSWWSHPRSHEIFWLVEEASNDPSVLSTKLIAGKVTLVHRSLWPALFAIATAREEWQMRRLSKPAAQFLDRVDKEGRIRGSGAAAKELEVRLLARSFQVHTESGRHETVLEPWPRPAKRIDPKKARAELEQAVIAIGGTATLLPWNRVTIERATSRSARSSRPR